jgi:hypothetical protein
VATTSSRHFTNATGLTKLISKARTYYINNFTCEASHIGVAGQSKHLLMDGSPFSTKAAYMHIQTQLQDPDAAYIWSSKVPKKVKVFGWLLHLNRINTRANLLHKHVIASQECPRCHAPVEDRSHLFFMCLASAAI